MKVVIVIIKLKRALKIANRKGNRLEIADKKGNRLLNEVILKRKAMTKVVEICSSKFYLDYSIFIYRNIYFLLYLC
jgi:hypothetical protein